MATPVDKDDDIFSHTIPAPPPTIVVTSEDVPDEGFIARLKKRGKFVTFKRLFSHSPRHHNDKQCESPSTPLEPIATRRSPSLLKRRSMESLDELFLDPCECNISVLYLYMKYSNTQYAHTHTHTHVHAYIHNTHMYACILLENQYHT